MNPQHVLRPLALTLLGLAGLFVSASAQEVTFPDPGLNAVVREALNKPNGPLTAQDLLGLTNLTAFSRNITNLQGLAAARNLSVLQLDDNHITDASVPTTLASLTNLTVLDFSGNPLTTLVVPGGLSQLARLRVEVAALTNLTLPAGLARLSEIRLGFNQLPSLKLPADLTNLSVLSAFQNQLTNVTLPPQLPRLSELNLAGNRLAQIQLPARMTNLVALFLSGNQLSQLNVPGDLSHLSFLRLDHNQLTSLNLPEGLTQLNGLFLESNRLVNLTLPPGLEALAILNLADNPLANLTLPPDLQKLIALFVASDQLSTLVVSEPLAATGLASVIESLQRQGVSVLIYPLEAQLVRPLALVGAFKFAITGPPGTYTVLGSTDLVAWSPIGVAFNPLGGVNFIDVTSNAVPRRFYRVQRQVPPANMVFIPPTTFTLGTPTTEASRRADEGPQTTVVLRHGFWIGKHEVTQREYQAVIGANPSQFPGDLDRPVETVSWLDATNYCARLTQQELAAGRLAPGSRYRLPTEAEWECAARAGTSTRFSFGDDPNFAALPQHAWYGANSGFKPHPVGQKAPNPWGLYDMEGNVFEWCQDWYGPYPGGTVTDPQGPASNAIGVKVIRGGAWDSPEADCRSGRRLTQGFSPFITDFILGFRVVLVTEP